MELPEDFTVTVTQEDWDKGREAVANGGRASQSCALAQAVKRTLPQFHTSCGYATVFLGTNDTQPASINGMVYQPVPTDVKVCMGVTTRFDNGEAPYHLPTTILFKRNHDHDIE